MHTKTWKRGISLLLCMAMLLGNLPGVSFAAENDGMCEHHTEHTDCGYAEGESACGYVCQLCLQTPEETTEPEDTTAPAETTEPEQACTGLTDCAAENHEDSCEKKHAEEKSAADREAADSVAAMINALPSLEEIQAKPLEEQGADYNQVQATYDAYAKLTEDQKDLLPEAEAAFGAYFDYFNGLTVPATTSGTCGENLTWTLDGGILTISGTGAMENYTDNDSAIYTMPWADFSGDIQKIVLKDGVTTVGDYAFTCTSITEAELPEGLLSIGDFAFSSCSELHEINLPDSLASIGSGAFSVSGITQIVLPDGLTALGGEAFHACANLTEINIPSGITELSDYVFLWSGIEKLTIPATVTYVGHGALRVSGNNAVITFEGDAPTFAGSTFAYTTATVYYPANNDTWTEELMQECADYGVITWVSYGDAPEIVAEGTCGENLTWVLDEDGVLTISGEGAMTDYYVDETTPPPWDALRNEIISLVIEDGVTSIGECAFSVCTNLQSIDFGQVSYISRNAFGHCTSLVGELTIPESVTYIGEYAFISCTSLTSVTMLGNLTSVGPGAFRECYDITKITFTGTTAPQPCSLGQLTSLKDIYVPGESIDAYMASISGDCPYAAIQAVDSEITQGTCGENLTWFFDETTCALTISGAGAMTDFKPPYGAPWSSYGHRSKIATVVIEDGITSIGDYAFRYCDNLCGNLVIPDSVTSLGENAFNDCGSIDVTIGSGLKEIPAGAFSNSGITTIDFGAITAIGDYAFSNCDGLDGDLVIPDTIISIGSSVFEDCDGIDTLTLGNGLTVLPFGAFMSCDDLKSIDIGNITVIPSAAFSGCKSLTSIDLKNVISIEPEAFSGCDSLVELILPDTVDTIYDYGFGECKNLASVTLGSGLTALGVSWTIPFHDCTGLKEITFTGRTVPAIAGDFTSLTALETVYVPAESLEAYATALNGILPANAMIQVMTPNRLILDSEAISTYDTVWIDGMEYTVQTDSDVSYIDLPDGNAKTMVAYTYHVGDASDLHTQYPTGMKVWTLDNEGGFYAATHQEELDDILQYAGSSIRATGKQGIRMITAIGKAKKNALISGGLAGYTLKEYGTVVAWASQLDADNPLVLGASYAKSNYAYKKGIADPVLAYDGDMMQYTNVLVGFSLDKCKDDVAMRPYMILADAAGNEITLYGGTVERSIGYIAYQNRNTFGPSTEAYAYIWGIIHAVYGDAYDAEYQGA